MTIIVLIKSTYYGLKLKRLVGNQDETDAIADALSNLVNAERWYEKDSGEDATTNLMLAIARFKSVLDDKPRCVRIHAMKCLAYCLY